MRRPILNLMADAAAFCACVSFTARGAPADLPPRIRPDDRARCTA